MCVLRLKFVGYSADDNGLRLQLILREKTHARGSFRQSAATIVFLAFISKSCNDRARSTTFHYDVAPASWTSDQVRWEESL